MTPEERRAAMAAKEAKRKAEYEAKLAAMTPDERAAHEAKVAAEQEKIDAERIRIEAEWQAKQKAALRAEAMAELKREAEEKAKAKREAKAIAAQRAKQKAIARAEAKTEIAEDEPKADEFQRPEGGGAPKPNQHNIGVALRKLRFSVSYDVFANQFYVMGADGRCYRLNDAEIVTLWLAIERKFKFKPGKDYFFDVVGNLARANSFHPVKRYLADVQAKWDEVERVDRWLVTYAGAEDTPFNRAIGRLWMVAAVRRIRKPGCKFDELPVLESPQGMQKSSMLATLAVKPEWFSDCVKLSVTPKEVIEQTQGKWIVEIAELSGMRKGELEGIKAFLSRSSDTARASYGRLSETVDRAFICAGTTNSERYLKDLTGNRRFWPVRLGKIDLEALRRDRDMLWAEAAVLEASGVSIRLDESLWAAAAEAQADRQEENPHLATLARALDDRTGKIAKASVYDLTGVHPSQRHQTFTELVADAMRTLGWEAVSGRIGGAKMKVFAKGTVAERAETLKVTWLHGEGRFGVAEASPQLDAFRAHAAAHSGARPEAG